MSTPAAFTGDDVPELAPLKELLRPLVAFYLDLHRNPELSGNESRTAACFAGWLEGEGYDVTRGVGGHGVVGVLRNGGGPRVLLRAELDALPVRERTGLAYASEGPVMHACGHDMHLAAAAGAASLLARAAGAWSGTLVVVGQPAEETLEGARAMLSDGLYERFGVPATVLAQHTAPLPAGMVAHAEESMPVLAASTGMEVVIHGRGGHAGAPHLAADPLATAAAVVMRLQGLATRETSPTEQAVVNVGSLHAGSGSNVIAERAELGITVRAFSQASLERLTAAVERTVTAECTATGCPRDPEIRTVSRSPVTLSDPEAGAAVRLAHRKLYGPERVCGWLPSMATEDFPLYSDAGSELHGGTGVSAVYWMVGATGAREWSRASGSGRSGDPEPPAANHSPLFAPDVRTGLPTAVTALTTAALARLGAPEPVVPAP